MKSIQMAAQPESSGSDSDCVNQVRDQTILVPSTFVSSIQDSFEMKDHSWFATSQIPTDISIQVQDITFHVHKYPLVSRCGYMAQIELRSDSNSGGYDLKLDNFPGGSETFGTILKFCYGLPIGLNPENVAAMRCASEYLQMTEEFENGNLISKTEAFLTFVVLSSWRDTITVLKSCETLSPWAENLQIARRCCDSIAWKASRENSNTGEETWWFDDVALLRIDHFSRIVTAMRAKELKAETIGTCLMRYAAKWLPSMEEMEMEGQNGYNQLQINILSGRGPEEKSLGQNKEQRMIVESLISFLPPQKEAVSCKFLLWMLKLAFIYSASPALISELEKRVGSVLENVDVNHLLLPNFTIRDRAKTFNLQEECTLHNIDSVQRIVEYFLMHDQQQKFGKANISKLLDSYLAEIARDPNLSITKFQVLAEVLPENARTCHDGLYRAIDTYLKSHPALSEHDRRRLCKVMDYEKLSLDACTHAAQNDRLPLRTVIQVLFSEQVKMRAAMQAKEQIPGGDNSDQEDGGSSTREINLLREELEKVKLKMQELITDYSELQTEYGKLNNKQRTSQSWALGWKKLKSSGVFNRKVDGNEAEEGQQNSTRRRLSLGRRRMSIS